MFVEVSVKPKVFETLIVYGARPPEKSKVKLPFSSKHFGCITEAVISTSAALFIVTVSTYSQ